MNILKEYRGYQLIKRYDKAYICFYGGREEDMPCEIPVAEEDLQRVIENTDVIDDIYCQKRYKIVVSLLKEMRERIQNNTYPRDYPVIPLFHYVERHMDEEDLYESVKDLDKWYAENYRIRTRM